MTFAMAEQDDGIINMPESWVYYGGQHEGARSMTPLPKQKVAAARRDQRRAHDFLTPSNSPQQLSAIRNQAKKTISLEL